MEVFSEPQKYKTVIQIGRCMEATLIKIAFSIACTEKVLSFDLENYLTCRTKASFHRPCRCTRNTTITVILKKLTRPKPSPESAGYAWLEKQPGKTKFNHLGKGSRSWLTELRLIKPSTSLVFDSPQLKDKEIRQQSEKLQTKSTALLVTSDPGSTVRGKKKY